jgi:hypothetical protein
MSCHLTLCTTTTAPPYQVTKHSTDPTHSSSPHYRADTTSSPITQEAAASHFWSLLGRSPPRSVSDNAAPLPRDILTDGTNDPSLLLHTASVPNLRSYHHTTLPNDLHTSTACANVVEDQASVASDMATLGQNSGDARRSVASSPRPQKGRENAKNTLCRNIGIYGHCRWEKDGCAFNHDVNSSRSNDNRCVHKQEPIRMVEVPVGSVYWQ